MRIITIIVLATVLGVCVGGAVAYIEVRLDPSPTTAPSNLQAPSPGADQAKAPRVQAAEPHFEFGTMQRGTTRSHDFIIRNVGTAPLRLQVGQTSCKCTLGDVTTKPIAPGEATHVRLEWAAKADNGPFRQTAMIHTNDPLQPEIELTIEGQVVDVTGVTPREFLFDKVPFGESRTAEVFVMAMLQDELRVMNAELSAPESREHFDVRVEPAKREELPDPSARDGVRITVTAKAGLPVGRFDQWLSLRTNLQGAERLEIPVIGRVVGDVSVHGVGWNDEEGVLVLGRIKSSEGRKSRVNLVVRGPDAAGVKFDVKSVDPPELRVTVGEPKKLRDTLLHVPLDIEVPTGTRPMVRLDTAQGEEGRIVLSTTHPKIKELGLTVRFSVER